jgi:hypothetical protein
MARNEDLRVALERKLSFFERFGTNLGTHLVGTAGPLEYLGSLAASRPGSPCSS